MKTRPIKFEDVRPSTEFWYVRNHKRGHYLKTRVIESQGFVLNALRYEPGTVRSMYFPPDTIVRVAAIEPETENSDPTRPDGKPE